MGTYEAGHITDIQPGERKILQLARRSIGIFNVNGTFYALKNSCIHDQAPVCLGKIGGTYLPSAPAEFVWGMEGQILRCPWHGWEFDIKTGCTLFDPALKLTTYPLNVTPDGRILIEIKGGG